MKRRNFLKSLGFISGSLFLAPELIFGRSFLNLSELKDELEKLDVSDEKFWKIVRAQFPIPADYIHFNTGGLGSSPYVVMERVRRDTYELDMYPTPSHDIEKWWDVKKKCADIFGCDKEEIALVGCATEGINIVINGLPLKRGDEVIMSTHEHAAGEIPILNRMKRDGIVIKFFDPDLKNGMRNVEKIEKLITKRTRLIFISHITCTTGQRFPEKEICQLAKDKGIWICLDGAQVPGMMPINVRDYKCDFYMTSGHKWMLGPERTGILYVKKDMLDVLRPITVGGYSDKEHNLINGELEFQPSAQRYEYGTQNPALFHGLGTAIDFLNTIGIKNIWQHNRSLAEVFYSEIKKFKNVEILSPEEERYRTCMITFRIKDIEYNKISSHLMSKRIRVRVVQEANLKAIRVSFHLYNTPMELAKLLFEIKELIRG